MAERQEVVRGFVGAGVDFENPPRGFSVWQTDEFDRQPPQPVAVLPINPDTGAVGPVEPWMVARMQEAEFSMRKVWAELAADPDKVIAAQAYKREADTWRDIATALSQILGGQDE